MPPKIADAAQRSNRPLPPPAASGRLFLWMRVGAGNQFSIRCKFLYHFGIDAIYQSGILPPVDTGTAPQARREPGMAASPEWKIYREGEYVAACKYAEDAAALASMVSGSIVKHGHSLIVWREGKEEFSAGESYDGAASIMEQRRWASCAEAYERVHGKLPT